MARGQADYGALATKEVGASVSDMGEVAARLGSIVIYDKRGDVVDFDNFEEPVIRWLAGYSVAAGSVQLDSTYAKSGSQTLKIVTGAGASATEVVTTLLSVLASKRLGIEISFKSLSSNVNLHFWIYYYDGIHYYGAELKIDRVLLKIYLKIAAIPETWAEVVDLTTFNADIWYTIKLVMDFNINTYVRLMFSDKEYDVSAYNLLSGNAVISPYVYIGMTIKNRVASSGSVWIDDFILTQEEP